MPNFIYSAKVDPKQVIRSKIEAESEQDALDKLAKMGYFPIELEQEDTCKEEKGFWWVRKLSNKDLAQFSRQLSSLIDSGVNIINSLVIVSNNSHKKIKVIVSDLILQIKNGKSLSESMSLHLKFFPQLYFSMIKAGETSGNMDIILKRLADYLEREQDLKDSLRQSLVYPAFIFVVGLITIVVLLTFVMPKLIGMFEDMNQLLPLPTKILIGVSGLLHNYWWVFLAVIFFLCFFWNRFSKSAHGKTSWDSFKLKVFFIGPLILKEEIARFSRTLSLLLSSGISIVHSLNISLAVLENHVLKIAVGDCREKIINGLNLSAALRKEGLFPDFMISIISVGEETGSLDKAFLRIASDYEKELESSLKIMTRMVEPVVILIMGLIVGFIVLAMLLPIFQINLVVK